MKTTPIHKLIEISEEGGNEATRPNWWWKQKISELVKEEKEMVEKAHRVGQRSAGVDPSVYEAMVYYENEL